MDVVHLLLVWLLEGSKRPPCGWSSCDRLYFPYCVEDVTCGLRLSERLQACPCYRPWTCWNLPFLQIFATSLFVWVPLSAPSGLYSLLCNGHNIYGNGSISFCSHQNFDDLSAPFFILSDCGPIFPSYWAFLPLQLMLGHPQRSYTSTPSRAFLPSSVRYFSRARPRTPWTLTQL